jgi:hypothetical protein
MSSARASTGRYNCVKATRWEGMPGRGTSIPTFGSVSDPLDTRGSGLGTAFTQAGPSGAGVSVSEGIHTHSYVFAAKFVSFPLPLTLHIAYMRAGSVTLLALRSCEMSGS